MKFKDKKAILIVGLFALVVLAGALNYSITSGGWFSGKEQVKSASTETEQTKDVFAAFRQERANTREKELTYIDSVVTSTETDSEVKAQAQEQKLTLVENMEKELTTEGLIQTSLGLESVVTVREDSVNVVVKKAELSDAEVAKITQIVLDETKESASNIKIMPQGV